MGGSRGSTWDHKYHDPVCGFLPRAAKRDTSQRAQISAEVSMLECILPPCNVKANGCSAEVHPTKLDVLGRHVGWVVHASANSNPVLHAYRTPEAFPHYDKPASCQRRAAARACRFRCSSHCVIMANVLWGSRRHNYDYVHVISQPACTHTRSATVT